MGFLFSFSESTISIVCFTTMPPLLPLLAVMGSFSLEMGFGNLGDIRFICNADFQRVLIILILILYGCFDSQLAQPRIDGLELLWRSQLVLL